MNIFKSIIKKIARNVFGSMLNDIDRVYLATGTLLSMQIKNINSTNINDYEFRVYSQMGDDGIIQFLINNIDIENKTFFEFGVEDYLESNTRFLMMNNNWEGFVMDGSVKAMKKLEKQPWYWKYSLTNKAVFITKENINGILKETGYKNIGLLHIDLDGNDYHILNSLDINFFNPSIIILEYNSVFGYKRPITVPYDDKFVRNTKHYSNLYWGASLAALNHLADRLGYGLIGCNLAGNNAYFIRRDLLNFKVKEIKLEDAFKESKFRESRNPNGTYSFLKGEDRLAIIKGLEVLNVITNEFEIL